MTCQLSKDQIRTWIADLRSGEFQQGKSVLHDPDTNSYCCLGVLARRLGTLEEAQTVDQEHVVRGRHVLSSAVESELMNMNDIRGSTFSEIADFVEETILSEAPDVMVPGVLAPYYPEEDDYPDEF